MLDAVYHIEGPEAPTLVLLHGYGSNKEDLYGLRPYLPACNLLCLQAPESLGMGGYAWYPIHWENGGKIIDPSDVEAAADLVVSSVENWRKEHGIAGKLFYGGFSQGAILSTRLLLNGIAADGYVLMSGYALPEWHPTLASFSTEIPIIQTHGTADPVIPFAWAESGATLLKTNPGFSFHSYPMGHQLNPACLQDIRSFLEKLF